MDVIHIIKATVDPSSAPLREGQHWINTATKKEFFSVGTSVVGDWIESVSGGSISAAIAAHEAASDPHPGYLTPAEGNAAYTPISHVGTGGVQHSNATTSVAGFMSAADKTKLDIIGGARIIKSGSVAAGSFTGTPRTATVTFGTAFPNTNYSIAIVGVNSRSWNFQTKSTTGFIINSNANAALSGEVLWTCISLGESVE